MSNSKKRNARADDESPPYSPQNNNNNNNNPQILSDEDDDEANADLSISIIAKANNVRKISEPESENPSHNISPLENLNVSSVIEIVKHDENLEADLPKQVGGDVLEIKNANLCPSPQHPTTITTEEQKTPETKPIDRDKELKTPHKTEEEKKPETKPTDRDKELKTPRKRGIRYFDPLGDCDQTCYNCGEVGHRACDCTNAKKKRLCYVCGDTEHEARDCKKCTKCFICKETGHMAKKCPQKDTKGSKINVEESICLLCGDLGHDMMSCRKGYKPEDLKKIKCYICKTLGHLCCIDIVDGCRRDISCYNCGEIGHTGVGCVKSKKGKTKEGSGRVCYICGEEGHIARGCRKTDKRKLGKRKRQHEQDDNAFFGFKSVPHHGKVSSLQETPKTHSNYAEENGQAGDDLSGFKSVPRNFGKLSSSSKSSEKSKAETTGRCKAKRKKGKEEASNSQSTDWASPKRNLSSSSLKTPENNNHSANENPQVDNELSRCQTDRSKTKTDNQNSWSGQRDVQRNDRGGHHHYRLRNRDTSKDDSNTVFQETQERNNSSAGIDRQADSDVSDFQLVKKAKARQRSRQRNSQRKDNQATDNSLPNWGRPKGKLNFKNYENEWNPRPTDTQKGSSSRKHRRSSNWK